MKFYKKIIFFIFLFLIILFLENNCFATTVEYNNWEGAPSYATIPALELSTTTDSYITLINNARSEIVVLEPYNSKDYIALSAVDTVENSTNNRFYGYSTSSNTLTDIRVHTSTFNTETQTWSSWSSASYASVSAYAPSNTNYIYKTKNNVVLYIEGLGIVGNQVIDTGIPLPEGITLIDNIVICRAAASPYYTLGYTDNKENTFNCWNWEFECVSASGSAVYFDYYIYNETTKQFEFNTNTNNISWDYTRGNYPMYAYNNVGGGKGKSALASNDFFLFTPLTETPEVEIPEVETAIPTLETVEQIPEVMIQTAKIVIPVGLVIFGILLIISLIKLVILRMI